MVFSTLLLYHRASGLSRLFEKFFLRFFSLLDFVALSHFCNYIISNFFKDVYRFFVLILLNNYERICKKTFVFLQNQVDNRRWQLTKILHFGIRSDRSKFTVCSQKNIDLFIFSQIRARTPAKETGPQLWTNQYFFINILWTNVNKLWTGCCSEFMNKL